MSASTWRSILLVIAVSLGLALITLWVGPDRVVDWLERTQDCIRVHAIQSAIILFLWSAVLFLTVLPLGTATILLAGALLGTWAGWVQFASQVVASIIIYETGGLRRQQAAIESLDARPRLKLALTKLQNYGFASTALLRIAPVVPSAACSIICKALGISRTKFIGGTLTVGWIRPVFFAAVGAATSLNAIRDQFGFL